MRSSFLSLVFFFIGQVFGENVPSGSIFVNGVALSDSQVLELEAVYKVKPKPGRYWYDGVSGLYGVEGHSAFGFMHPGHGYGELNPNASKGDVEVYVNGRKLPQSEWAIWSHIIGTWIEPGRYWLDGQGNAGQQGNPMPLLNLYVAAQQNGYPGQGESGDNFWSTRFSAGNSNADNSQGYVSVPGYGPVGYGF